MILARLFSQWSVQSEESHNRTQAAMSFMSKSTSKIISYLTCAKQNFRNLVSEHEVSLDRCAV